MSDMVIRYNNFVLPPFLFKSKAPVNRSLVVNSTCNKTAKIRQKVAIVFIIMNSLKFKTTLIFEGQKIKLVEKVILTIILLGIYVNSMIARPTNTRDDVVDSHHHVKDVKN